MPTCARRPPCPSRVRLPARSETLAEALGGAGEAGLEVQVFRGCLGGEARGLERRGLQQDPPVTGDLPTHQRGGPIQADEVDLATARLREAGLQVQLVG